MIRRVLFLAFPWLLRLNCHQSADHTLLAECPRLVGQASEVLILCVRQQGHVDSPSMTLIAWMAHKGQDGISISVRSPPSEALVEKGSAPGILMGNGPKAAFDVFCTTLDSHTVGPPGC